MNKYYNGGILIYLSIIVMFIGLSIVYLLNSTGISIFQNYKADIVRSQLLHNIKSGMAIFDDAELPDFDVNNELLDLCLDSWSEILDEDRDKVFKKALFYMGLHFIRMIPFRLRKKEQQYLTPILLASKFINDSYNIKH